MYPTSGKPLLVSEGDEEVAIRVSLCDFADGGAGEVVIVVVAYNDGVDDGYIFDFAGHLGIPFRT